MNIRSDKTGPDGGRSLDTLLTRWMWFAGIMVLIFTATGMRALLHRAPASSQSITLYETARLLRGQSIGRIVPTVSIENAGKAPGSGEDPTARLLAKGLARHVHVPSDAVRLRLGSGPQVPLATLERQYRLFAGDGVFDPILYGPFTAALQNSDRSWTVLTRTGANEMSIWQVRNFAWPVAWLLVGFCFAVWFSKRIARPIEQFSDAAERFGKGERLVSVPVAGPLEIRKAAQAINEMQARILGHIAEKATVTAAIAHDLRAPLSRLRFRMAKAPRELCDDVEADIREMEEMVRKMLEFVEQNVRVIEAELVDLAFLVEGVVDDFADQGQDVALTASAHLVLRGDPLFLKRMVANLVENALKYAGSARLTVQAAGDDALIEVKDRGPGMSDSCLDRAFDPFFRAEPSRNRETGGVGLGLAVVKSVVEAHSGQVELLNRDGGGLVARVRLPLSS